MNEHDPAHEINFAGDDEQDWFDRHHSDEKDHFFKAMKHQIGAGPHPGVYSGPGRGPRPEPREDVSEELAREWLHEQGPAPETPPAGPLPPQEAVDQPSGGKGKGKPAAKPHGQTPVATAEQVVQPEPPQGAF